MKSRACADECHGVLCYYDICCACQTDCEPPQDNAEWIEVPEDENL